ncbi:MAG: hypothetical protein A2133_11955 [Actinobacteria bacterium RBG_16_64_13]|nr:MAG: hypothetical protein A2133_11955 [Actinobacteria bacterium RBG_16_64_13]
MRERHFRGLRQEGSILLLVLFMCMGVAVVVQSLFVVVVCAERAMSDERAGRERMEEKDQGLAELRQRALGEWVAMPWAPVGREPAMVEGALFELPEGNGWVLRAIVRQDPRISRLSTSAWLERGRDGIEVPSAALVAWDVAAAEGRDLPWLEAETGQAAGGGEPREEAAAVGYLHTLPAEPTLGSGCVLNAMSERWRLDPGWRELGVADEGSTVAAGPGVTFMGGGRGQTMRLTEGASVTALDSPALVVVTGGADLDARGRGDFYGVMVVDEGSVRLEGTIVHGAVFVTRTADFGVTGKIVFSRALLRWATDRSLTRVRLVPGTRWEGTE